MVIINNQNIISNKQIERIVKALGRDYRASKIVVYETKLDMIRFYPQCYNFSMEEFWGKLEGSYDPSSDVAYICIFAQTDDGEDLHSKQLYSLHALVHELRHRYQYVNDYLVDDDEKAEQDADNFATRFINNQSRRISKIMNWKDEWTVEEID
jgi:hypothetical protein